jgi:hypothetical protein
LEKYQHLWKVIHGEIFKGDYSEEQAIEGRNAICELIKNKIAEQKEKNEAEKVCEKYNLIELIIKGMSP